jgi:TDG/mug DNA glycosylase family protein
LRSEAVGHHFAGPGNPFWKLLYAAGLIPEPLTYSEDHRLADFQMALTNFCPRATRSASELRREELESCKRTLEQKIHRLRPELVAFVGVTLYKIFFGRSRLSPGGPGLKPDRIYGARVFVLPNPSGLNASFPSFSAKLKWFKRLRRALQTGHPLTRRASRRPSP